MIYGERIYKKFLAISLSVLLILGLTTPVLSAKKKETKAPIEKTKTKTPATITVTRVEVVPWPEKKGVKRAKVMLNECIVIKEIEVRTIEEEMELNFPVYVSKRGKEYPLRLDLQQNRH